MITKATGRRVYSARYSVLPLEIFNYTNERSELSVLQCGPAGFFLMRLSVRLSVPCPTWN